MPPCAATVWLRVGKDLGNVRGFQARFRAAHGGAQGRYHPRPTTTVS